MGDLTSGSGRGVSAEAALLADGSPPSAASRSQTVSPHSPRMQSARSPVRETATPSVVLGSVEHLAGGHNPAEPTTDDIIVFGGIPDPMSEDRRVSHRIQAQPDADDLQLGRAMRAAKLRDIEATTGMTVNTRCSILHFSDDEIIQNANNLGVSLGSNGKEVAKSVNDLQDLEADRAMEMIRNFAALKPMNDSNINALGVGALDCLCEDLVPYPLLCYRKRMRIRFRGVYGPSATSFERAD